MKYLIPFMMLALAGCEGSDPENIVQTAVSSPSAPVYQYEVRTSATNTSFEIEGMTTTQNMDTGVQNQTGTGSKSYFIEGETFQGQTERFSGIGHLQTLVFKDGVLIYNQSITTPTGTVQWSGL